MRWYKGPAAPVDDVISNLLEGMVRTVYEQGVYDGEARRFTTDTKKLRRAQISISKSLGHATVRLETGENTVRVTTTSRVKFCDVGRDSDDEDVEPVDVEDPDKVYGHPMSRNMVFSSIEMTLTKIDDRQVDNVEDFMKSCRGSGTISMPYGIVMDVHNQVVEDLASAAAAPAEQNACCLRCGKPFRRPTVLKCRGK